MRLCDYKCGNVANYQFKNGKWCCSNHSNKCQTFRNRYKGAGNPFSGKRHKEETKKKWKKNRRVLFGKENGMYGMTKEKNPFFEKTHTHETKSRWKINRNNPDYKKKMSKIMEMLWKEEWFIKTHRKYTDEELGELACYYKDVWKYTRRAIKNYSYIINPENKKIGNKEYHIDHKYSISEGFKNKVSPKIIGSHVNLEILPWIENIRKNKRCSIFLAELKDSYENNI